LNLMNNDFLGKITYRQKIGVSALIFLLAIFALICWLIAPAVAAVEATKIKLDSQSQQAEKDYAEGLSLKKLTENIKVIEPRVNELEKIFINKNDSLSFITSLETAAAKNNVSEKTDLGDETALDEFYGQIPLTINVQGNFSGLVGFISALETLPETVNIDSLQITALSDELAAKTATATPEKILVGAINAASYWSN